jgi:hypothetical protein
MDSPAKGPACSAKDFLVKGPSCTMWFKQVTKYVTCMTQRMMHIPTQPSKTQPIAFLISKEVVPYRTRRGTCCPGVSTLKIWSLAYSSTTCHDGINHLHHSNRCSNHRIDPHTVISHIDGWKTTTISQRHKPNSTSQRTKILVRLSRCHG